MAQRSHRGACAGEAGGGGFADAGTSTGNQCDLAFQLHAALFHRKRSCVPSDLSLPTACDARSSPWFIGMRVLTAPPDKPDILILASCGAGGSVGGGGKFRGGRRVAFLTGGLCSGPTRRGCPFPDSAQ